MRKRENLILLIGGVVLIVLTLFEPRAAWWVQGVLRGGLSWEDEGVRARDTELLRLRSERATLDEVLKEIPYMPEEGITAFVYSAYPFNLKNEILISKGSEDGVRIGSAVTYHRLLMGEVVEVYAHASRVKTVFDSSWQSAVRIGAHGAESLLAGGNVPRLTLIDKRANIDEGDVVVSASREFPYGLSIGEARNIALSRDTLFKEADAVFPYYMRDVQVVSVFTEHVGE